MDCFDSFVELEGSGCFGWTLVVEFVVVVEFVFVAAEIWSLRLS